MRYLVFLLPLIGACELFEPAVIPDGSSDNNPSLDTESPDDTATDCDPQNWYADADADGYGDLEVVTQACEAPSGFVSDKTDCDDTDASINPGAEEVCNGRDDDCNDLVDDGLTGPYYVDSDGDGYGNPAMETHCNGEEWLSLNALDCDDGDASINPDADEICDEIDNDCDELVDDEDEDVTDGLTWYADADLDGYGDAESTMTACVQPSGYTDDAADCDDSAADIYPDADEFCDEQDNDCDGEVDEGLTSSWYADVDGDGYGDAESLVEACLEPSGYVADATDCDDSDAEVSPAGSESCNGTDDDCDGLVDEDVSSTYYIDSDGDGYGDADTTALACEAPSGYVMDATDCDDADSGSYPGADEYCDGVDNDCDGSLDESDAVDVSTWYADADTDGYGDVENSLEACTAPSGYVPDSSDCDDGEADANPGSDEYCDAIDNDCDGDVDEDDALDATTWYADGDEDGYGVDSDTLVSCEAPSGYTDLGGDCEDTDDDIYPDAREWCDEQDNDCDGDVDEDVGTLYYADADGDGYGDSSVTDDACDAPSGYVPDSTDCDDADAEINPGASESCDSVDNDCDGDVDEDDAVDASTWYADADSDSYGDVASTATSCAQPSGYVSDATDCDDTDATVYPEADESCNGLDDDCDGDIDEQVMDTFFADADSDGYGDATSTTEACEAPSGYTDDSADCDDSDATVNPAAEEICDGVDQDCDGDVDEGVMDTFFADLDGDGYGNAASTTEACSAPSGYTSDDTDCDDVAGNVYPGATESCDELDNDCDGTVDEGVTDTFYADADSDGYGDAASTIEACSQPSGYLEDATDCDDTEPSVNPGASESCNDIDDDCDGTVDEDDAVDASTWYADADGDSFGDATSTATACDEPSGYTDDSTDCDDTDSSISPAASELCDSVDNDCDGDVDEETVDASTFYADLDGDGFGDAGSTTTGCEVPSGYTSDDTDCDDVASNVYPGAEEYCDGLDNDCDEEIDEGVMDTYFVDADADGYGDATSSTDACAQPSGYVSDATDCDDADAATSPGEAEICDAIDNDCDGDVDEDDATDASTWYADADGDSYGDLTQTATACAQPSGYSDDATDCDDTDAMVYPEAPESCNGVDDDCDGDLDEDVTSTFYADVDEDGYGDATSTDEACEASDGFVADATDCDDTDATINPAADETCDGVDEDCDGETDEDAIDGMTWYEDVDGDGFGDSAESTYACSAPSGYVADDADCDDLSWQINPDAIEICDGVDNDCDGNVDEGVTTRWYEDLDADGYGNDEEYVDSCEEDALSGYVLDATDCDDDDASVTDECLYDDTGDTGSFEDTGDSDVDDTDTDDTGSMPVPGPVDTADSGDVNEPELVIDVTAPGGASYFSWYFFAELITEEDIFDIEDPAWNGWSVIEAGGGMPISNYVYDIQIDEENLLYVRWQVAFCDGSESDSFDTDHCTYFGMGQDESSSVLTGEATVTYLDGELTSEPYLWCYDEEIEGDTADTGASFVEICGTSVLNAVE